MYFLLTAKTNSLAFMIIMKYCFIFMIIHAKLPSFFAIFPVPHLLKQNPCTPYKNEKGTKFAGENVGPKILFICSTLRHWQSILSFTFWKWSEAEVTHQSIVIGKRNTTLVYWCYAFLQEKAVLILRNPHIWNVINIFFSFRKIGENPEHSYRQLLVHPKLNWHINTQQSSSEQHYEIVKFLRFRSFQWTTCIAISYKFRFRRQAKDVYIKWKQERIIEILSSYDVVVQKTLWPLECTFDMLQYLFHVFRFVEVEAYYYIHTFHTYWLLKGQNLRKFNFSWIFELYKKFLPWQQAASRDLIVDCSFQVK